MARCPQKANRRPSKLPATASSRLSVRAWRTSRARVAPRADRSAISLCRAAPRASSRLATLVQAASKTSATAAINNVSGLPNSSRSRERPMPPSRTSSRCPNAFLRNASL